MHVALTLTAFLIPWQHSSVVPELDRGLALADIVVFGHAVDLERGGRRLVIDEHIAGRRPSGPVDLADLSRFGLHERVPRDRATRLLFLQRGPAGWMPVQLPGLTRRIDAVTADVVRATLRSIAAVIRAEATPARLDRHVGLTRRLAGTEPELAAASLLAVARRPVLADRMSAAARAELRALLRATSVDARVRDQAARCLCAAREQAGEARHLGPTFGRLLFSMRGAATVPWLADLAARGAGGAQLEIVRAALATQTPEARRWAAGLLRDAKR